MQIGNVLDPRFNSPPEHNLTQFYSETQNTKPILFILSSSVNPLNELQIIKNKLNMRVKIQYLPLGNSIDDKVKELILEGTKNGDWVLLENLHLVTDWLLLLEKLIQKLKPETTHPNFRLWMSSMPVDYFPVSFLQNCQKITLQPAKGIKQNTIKLLNSIPENTLDM
jgi:dynein heavy chain, axonemal